MDRFEIALISNGCMCSVWGNTHFFFSGDDDYDVWRGIACFVTDLFYPLGVLVVIHTTRVTSKLLSFKVFEGKISTLPPGCSIFRYCIHRAPYL